jgi:putative endonuclease
MYSSLKPESLGKEAENFAFRALKNNGHRIIVRNFKTKNGEIDLISQKDDVIYINEVKKRTYFEENCVKQSQIERIWHTFEDFLKIYPQYEIFEAIIQLLLVSKNTITIHEIL